jgi:hypothetical protein
MTDPDDSIDYGIVPEERMDYLALKELAAGTGQSVQKLLALDKKNDPFYCGTESQLRDAEWFAEIFKSFGFSDGVHLRRIHYRIISDKGTTLRPDNRKPYENTDDCWNYLVSASKAGRYLGLVDPASFVDKRNPDPQNYADYRMSPPAPDCTIDEPTWSLPGVDIQLECDLEMPEPYITGYDYELADQHYYLAVWIEKSTMNDILEPVCRRLGLDLVVGIGFQSVTSVINMLRKRVFVFKKPARIFYISDFDPAGEQMPVSTARQIQFWIDEYAPGAEIKLMPLALTKEQVIRYRLPRTPIKESDKRKGKFEDRHGEGAVELDAIEALHPGQLARLIRNAVRPYFDDDLDDLLRGAHHEAEDAAEAAWEVEIEPEVEQLEQLKTEAQAVAEKFRERAEELKRDFEIEMTPIAERVETVRRATLDKIAGFEAGLPVRPEAAGADVDESDWLYDSRRSYLDQNEAYRRYKATSDRPKPSRTQPKIPQ